MSGLHHSTDTIGVLKQLYVKGDNMSGLHHSTDTIGVLKPLIHILLLIMIKNSTDTIGVLKQFMNNIKNFDNRIFYRYNWSIETFLSFNKNN